ncbi:hypothetical protein Pelo_3552 [Pelomyxa schiedti]|nr:hypothetical protein Pelo_3552 [Pelomyxa schiedti]
MGESVSKADLARGARMTKEQRRALDDAWASCGESHLNEVKFGKLMGQVRRFFSDCIAIREVEFNGMVFHLLDSEHTGLISRESLFAGLSLLTYGNAKEKAMLAFNFADKNGDGRLTKEELKHSIDVTIFYTQIILTMGLAKTEFASLLDRPGVDALEIIRNQAIISAQQYVDSSSSLILDTVNKIFAAADDNNDGIITADDWLKKCEVVPEIRCFFKCATGVKLRDPTNMQSIIAMDYHVSEIDLSEAEAARKRS